MFQSQRFFGKNRPYHLSSKRQTYILLTLLMILGWMGSVVAQSSPSPAPTEAILEMRQTLQVGLDTTWVLFTACLVFFMNAGFAMLETGFCRQKNAVNLLAKNLIVFALTTVAFWSIGFGLMFGDGNPLFGIKGFFLGGADNSPNTGFAYQGVYHSLAWAGIPLEAKFFFELVFAGVAATIVSGAVAERIKFFAFFIFSLLMGGLIYPLSGHWIWGGGWLAQLGFWDFAGSTAVHSVAGWAALVGAVILGPRIGKYQQGNSLALPGHNLPLATLGCFILWLGWFGFNPGSTLAANPPVISHIFLTTNMAAAMGGIAATLTSWRYFGKPDLSVIINGILGGLVAITASCRYVDVSSAAIIGLVGGIIIVFAVDFFDRFEIDDPVGALSVHLVCGIWGTLAISFFALGPNTLLNENFILYTDGPAKGILLGGGLEGIKQMFIQLLGIAAVSLSTTILSWVGWSLVKYFIGLRVSFEEELKGLDISEHGLYAYSGFLMKQDSSPQNFSPEISRQLPPAEE